MRLAVVAMLLMYVWAVDLAAEEKTKATVLVRGVHCDTCVAAIRKELAAVEGVKVDTDKVLRGKKPRYFSEPFVVEVGATLATGIGALAKATAAAKTPHKDDIPPRLNLVLYTDRTIDEPSVMALRAALRKVNGVLVQESGGLGGMPSQGFYWIRLEPAGGADLQDVFKAAKSATEVSLLKN
jgi:copper chaperone CopZ